MIRVLILALLAGLVLGGCATNPSTGEKEVDAQACASLFQDLQAAKLACPLINTDTAERDIRICTSTIDIITIVGRDLGCPFADDVDGSEDPTVGEE
jgi:hypothetical protein